MMKNKKIKNYEDIESKANENLTVSMGLKAGVPIFLGYFPIAMAFGILSKGTGLSLYETLGFSMIVFAGAAQFIGVSMIAMGGSGLEIILTTLFLNFRHFLMSASLAPKIKDNHFYLKPLISYFITDESFSVASFANGQLTAKYMVSMELTGYVGWATGSCLGYIIGSVLPPLLQESMGIGLYAMFVALLVPELKKNNKAIVLAVLAGLVNTVLSQGLEIAQGWSIVGSIVIVSAIGALIFQEEVVVMEDE